MRSTKILMAAATIGLLTASPAMAASTTGSASTSTSGGASLSTGAGVKAGVKTGVGADANLSGSNTINGRLSGSDASGSTHNSTAPAAGTSAGASVDVTGQLKSLVDKNDGALTKAKFESETNGSVDAQVFNQIDGNRDGKISSLEIQAYENAATR